MVDNMASKVRSDAPILLGNKYVNIPAAPERARAPSTNRSDSIPMGVNMRIVKKIINPPVRTKAKRKNSHPITCPVRTGWASGCFSLTIILLSIVGCKIYKPRITTIPSGINQVFDKLMPKGINMAANKASAMKLIMNSMPLADAVLIEGTPNCL